MRSAKFPLLHKQERRLIADELLRRSTGRSGVYTQFATAFHSEAPIQSDALARAVNATIARHAALRTVVKPSARYDGMRELLVERFARTGLFLSGLYEQEILASSEIDVPVRTCCDDETLAAIGHDECSQPLNLQGGPVVRAVVITGPERHVAIVSLSHLILDLWATRIVHSEIARVYSALVAGRPWVPGDVPVQQDVLVRDELAMLQSPAGDRHKQFWSAHYAELGESPIGMSEVPFAKSSPGAPEFATLRLELPDAVVQQISVACGAAPDYAFWRTMYGIALGVLVNKSRVAIWANFLNRRRPGAQTAVAWCVHPHLLAVDARWARPWAEVWRDVRSGIRHAQAHEQYSVDTLGQSLGRLVDGHGTRLSFDLLPEPRYYEGAQLQLTDVPGVSRPADLDVRVQVRGSGYSLVATFDARRYGHDGVRHLLALFDATIRASVAAPTAVVGDVVRSVRQRHRAPRAHAG